MELWNDLTAFWTNLSRVTRFAFAAAVAAVIVLLLCASWWASRPHNQVLFSDLSARDAAAIVDGLKRMKVPYQLAEGGSKILVDEKIVLETRLNLMGSGVPISGGVGFEIFDNKDVGMTEYMQKVNYQRALQGELVRTIMANDQLKSARVHLVTGEGGLFSRDKSHPKASVSVVVKPGAQLNGEQVLGIQRLVAAAVSGLDPSQVTITDQRGVALSADAEGDSNEPAAAGKLRYKKQADDYLTRKVSDLLDRAFGPGQAIVSVDATLNFDEIRHTEQSIKPISGRGEEVGAVVRKRESIYRQPGQSTTKISDLTEHPADTTGTLTSTTDVEYELSKTAEQILSLPGGIRRISVGVIVPQALDDEQLGRVRDIVGMAVGFNAQRGDAITVQPLDRLVTRPAPAAESEVPPPRIEKPVASVAHDWRANGVDIAVGLLGLIALLASAIHYFVTRRGSPPASGEQLSASERNQLLADIKTWIEAEKIAAEGTVKQ